MRRWEFIALLGGAAVSWPLAAHAQQPERVRRIGVLMGIADDVEAKARIAAFLQALRQLGWTDGRNVQFDYRFGGGDAGRLRTYAAELVALTPDVILVSGSLALAAMGEQARSIPIVFTQVTDPVRLGFVANLARPGGHITGFTVFEYPIGGKWLELLREIAPGIVRVTVLLNPQSPISAPYVPGMKSIAASLGVQLITAAVRDPAEMEHALDAFAGESGAGLIVLPDASVPNLKFAISPIHLACQTLCEDDMEVQRWRGDGWQLWFLARRSERSWVHWRRDATQHRRSRCEHG